MVARRARRNVFSRLASAFTSPTGTLRPFRLFNQDLLNLFKRYRSDWTIFNQIVIASAVFVFFTNLLPGITFASDLYFETGRNWGTIEIVLSTGLCNGVSALFGLQPLTILGVTGSFTVIAENLYTLTTNTFNVEFLPFMAWSLIHACWMLWLLAIFNAHEWTMLYVTDFTCEIFSLLNSIIYFHKALQEFQRSHAELEFDAFLFSVIDGVGTFLLALFLSSADMWKPVFPASLRMICQKYATAIAVCFFVGIGYVGDAKGLAKNKLSVSGDRFAPSSPDRDTFFVQFWTLPMSWAGVTILPGAIIAMLFFFDHEISTIICTGKRFGIRKPKGYALEIMLLGLTTAVCGLLGIPPANGLLPQAPLHSQSLTYTDKDEKEYVEEVVTDRNGQEYTVRIPKQRVHEQRWSKLLHAGVILACIAPPLQKVLGLTPNSVLAGLFMFMGQQSLSTNPILQRFLYLLTPASQLPAVPPGVRGYWPIHGYTAFQILVTVAVFAVTLSPAGPAFPILIISLVPFRLLALPRIWSRDVLMHVDKWSCRDGTPEQQPVASDEDDEEKDDAVDRTPRAPLLPSLTFSEEDIERAWLGRAVSVGTLRSTAYVGRGT